MSDNIDTMIADWADLKSKLAYYKKAEMELRKEIAKNFKIDKLSEGKSHFQTDGYMVELTRKFSYNLDLQELEEIEDELDDDEKNCIVTKRSLSVSKYRDLFDSSIIDQAVITTDAAPTLTVTARTD